MTIPPLLHDPAGRAILALAAVALLAMTGSAAASSLGATPAHPAPGSSTAQGTAGLHPWAVRATSGPSASPAIYSTHYWAGAYFSGTARSATQLAFTMQIPNAVPSSSEFYYVLLSVWDNAGSYDQVGFTNDYGHWGFTYSYTSACAGTYYYNPNVAKLVRGDNYTFTMNLSSSGTINFAARQGPGKYVAHIQGHTGGTLFVDQGTYTCSSGTYYDYTDYEEVYTSVQPMPSFDYFFRANTQNNTSVTHWSTMSAPSGGGKIASSGSQVEVENEAFYPTFQKSPAAVVLANNVTTYALRIYVHLAFSGTNVTFQLNAPYGFNATFAPAAGAVPISDGITLTIGNASVLPRNVDWDVDLEVVDASGAYSYVTLQVDVK